MSLKIKLNSNSIYYFINCLCFFTIMLGTINSNYFCGLEISKIQEISRYITFIVFLCIFAKNNYKKIKFSTLFYTCIALCIVGKVYVKIDDAIMIVTLMSILAGKNIDVKKMALYIYRVIFVFILTVLFLCMIGQLQDIYIARSGSLRAGHSFGFLGANAFASNVFVGLVYYVYAKKDQWKIKNYVCCILVIIITYAVTKSRMTFLLEILTIFLIWIARKKRARIIIYKIQKYSFAGAAVITFILTKWYMLNPGGKIQNILNLFTTGRLYWISYFWEENGLSLWGNRIKLVGAKMAALTGSRWQGIDNAYAILAIHYGIMLLILLSVAYIYLGNYLKNNKNYIGAICVLILALWGVTENNIIIIGYNLGFYLMAEMGWKTKKNQVRNKPVTNEY